MNTIIFDACSLIYLTKIHMKEKLPELGKIMISHAVKTEIIADIERFPDANIIKKNLDKNLINEINFKFDNKPILKGLGAGEIEIIEICTKKLYIPVTDDQKALNYGLSLGLKPKTSEVILLDLLKQKTITHQEFKGAFDKLAIIKLLKQDVISFFLNEAEKIKK